MGTNIWMQNCEGFFCYYFCGFVYNSKWDVLYLLSFYFLHTSASASILVNLHFLQLHPSVNLPRLIAAQAWVLISPRWKKQNIKPSSVALIGAKRNCRHFSCSYELSCLQSSKVRLEEYYFLHIPDWRKTSMRQNLFPFIAGASTGSSLSLQSFSGVESRDWFQTSILILHSSPLW